MCSSRNKWGRNKLELKIKLVVWKKVCIFSKIKNYGKIIFDRVEQLVLLCGEGKEFGWGENDK